MIILHILIPLTLYIQSMHLCFCILTLVQKMCNQRHYSLSYIQHINLEAQWTMEVSFTQIFPIGFPFGITWIIARSLMSAG